MSVLFSRGLGDTPYELVPVRQGRNPLAPVIKPDDELRNSVVWAALRVRADLISTLPVTALRTVDGIQVPVPNQPSILTSPGALFVGGPLARIDEWLYATQMDLDRFGNAFGLIITRDQYGNPTRIDLIPASQVTVSARAGVVTYKINGKSYDADEIWHERQYVISGLPVGLSPVAYAAMALGQYNTAEQFAATWFSAGAIPSAMMKNTAKTLSPKQASDMKTQMKSTLAAGDLLVVGSDWDYHMMAVPPAQAQFLDAMDASAADCARFFNVPGDIVDLAVKGSSVTYANISQRNTQLLIVHLGPSIIRRERALSSLTVNPMTVSLTTQALLRMDPLTSAAVIQQLVASRVLTPNEQRMLDNRPDLTPEQEQEFIRLFPPKNLQFPSVDEIEGFKPVITPGLVPEPTQ